MGLVMRVVAELFFIYFIIFIVVAGLVMVTSAIVEMYPFPTWCFIFGIPVVLAVITSFFYIAELKKRGVV